nr:hypothetical protein [Rhodococcus sp. (in: high G+C Gram-positive bacteria)]
MEPRIMLLECESCGMPVRFLKSGICADCLFDQDDADDRAFDLARERSYGL